MAANDSSLWASLFALVFFVGSAGCDTSCDDAVGDETPVEITTGFTDIEAGIYESVAVSGEWHEFLPQRRLLFPHGLGHEPIFYQSFVSFHRAPLSEDRPNFSESAGNHTIWERVDEEFIQVRNDTCQTFYLRVVASLR